MAIKNFPTRIYKTTVPAIDREMAQREPITVSGSQDISATALDEAVSANSDWILDSIAFNFSTADARNFTAAIRNGRKVVTNFNDYLWFHVDGTLWQQITLDAGFYTGTELATELKTQLDANTVYAAEGITFTVVYDSATGLYTITPSSGTIKYLEINDTQQLSTRQSIAGHLFGLTETDSAFAASISSDATVFGLNMESPIISETGNTDLQVYHDDIHTLSIDQSLHLTSNSGVSLTIDFSVVYEEIV